VLLFEVDKGEPAAGKLKEEQGVSTTDSLGSISETTAELLLERLIS